MMLTFWILFSVLVFLVLVTVFRLRRTVQAGSELGNPDTIERLPNFYAPMERLLSESDFRFLKTRPEISPASISRLRRERRRLFRKYLGCLAADFTSITNEIRAIMVQSSVSRADLAETLVRARLMFTLAMVAVELRLMLHACGIYGLTISTGDLTQSLAQLRTELTLSRAAMIPA